MEQKNNRSQYKRKSWWHRIWLGRDNEAARNVWIKQTLDKLPSGHKILDAGAGEQKYKTLCTHLEYVSQDFCQYTAQGDGTALQRKEWLTHNIDIVSDIVSIPVEDASFDVILCTEVFEHIVSPELALREFNRILKPGGILILTAPFASLTHFAPYHFYSGFNRYFYKTMLPSTGFSIDQLDARGDYFDYLAQEIRRLPNVWKKYMGARRFVLMLVARIFIRLMQLGYKPNNSDELLCFGYHCIARKKIE